MGSYRKLSMANINILSNKRKNTMKRLPTTIIETKNFDEE